MAVNYPVIQNITNSERAIPAALGVFRCIWMYSGVFFWVYLDVFGPIYLGVFGSMKVYLGVFGPIYLDVFGSM